MPQVLAVNILGRFLLNNDRNIRLVLLSFPLRSFLPTFLLVFLILPSFLSNLSGSFYRFFTPQGQRQSHYRQREGDASQPAVFRPSSLITFPGDIPLEPHQKVTVCLLMLIS